MDRKKVRCGIGILVLASLLLLGMYCRPVFYLNDDTTMQSILSGTYTGVPDGHAVYMKYPLTGVLSLLYRVLPMVPWFSCLFGGCVFACVSLVLNEMHLFAQNKNKTAGFYLMFLFLTGIFYPNFIYAHYTITAALLAGTAAFLLMADRRLSPVILLWFCYMIRSQVFFWHFPFLCAVVLFLLTGSNNWKEALKKQALVWGAVAGCVLLSALLDAGMYSAEEWRTYRAYNEARTELYDYTNLLSGNPYDERYEEIGLTKSRYEVIKSYNTVLDDSIDTGVLQNTTECVKALQREARDGKGYFYECVRKYYYHVTREDLPYNYLVLALYVVLFVSALVSGIKKRLLRGKCGFWILLLALLGVGRSIVWIYLIWKDRFPERIVMSLYYIEILMLLGLLYHIGKLHWVEKPSKKNKWVYLSVAATLGGIFLYFTVTQNRLAIERAEQQASIQTGWNQITSYCEAHPDNLYLLDVFSVVSFADMQYAENGAGNCMMAGGWLSGSPLVTKKLLHYGGTNAADMLKESDNTYLIMRDGQDISWLEEFFTERYGESRVILTEQILNRPQQVFNIYQIR